MDDPNMRAYGEHYKPTVETLTQQLAAEKLRADAFREVLMRVHNHICHVPHCRGCALLARKPEEWAALALGGKEQSNG